MAGVANLSGHSKAIRERRRVIDGYIAAARTQVTQAHAQLTELQAICQHDDAGYTSHMGESCHHCNDCGKCDV